MKILKSRKRGGLPCKIRAQHLKAVDAMHGFSSRADFLEVKSVDDDDLEILCSFGLDMWDARLKGATLYIPSVTL